jgi:hypothetical protein
MTNRTRDLLAYITQSELNTLPLVTRSYHLLCLIMHITNSYQEYVRKRGNMRLYSVSKGTYCWKCLTTKPCGGWFEYLHCSPWAVRWNDKETQCQRYKWITLILAHKLGESHISEGKIWWWFLQDFHTRMTALARSSSSSKSQTISLLREDATHKDTSNYSKVIKNVILGPRWLNDTKRDWPTGRRSLHNFDFDLT